ncbi:hypothetical protein [Massilia sp. PWRC2]|uniref:hypothetical protein n=1 Tax=Massilia sp. PWRC2 TaxID=2804626 RepID=UPI003CE96EA1
MICLHATINGAAVDIHVETWLTLPDLLRDKPARTCTSCAAQAGLSRQHAIINATAASSPISGGVVWGSGQALHEAPLAEHVLGRFMNHNLSQSHIAINANIDVIGVPEDDRVVSRSGAKGVGEIGQLRVAAAIADVLCHTTGTRLRSLPMRPQRRLPLRPPSAIKCHPHC